MSVILFIVIMQTEYFITTKLKPSVSRATLAYAIKTVTSIIRSIKTLNYSGYKMNQVS